MVEQPVGRDVDQWQILWSIFLPNAPPPIDLAHDAGTATDCGGFEGLQCRQSLSGARAQRRAFFKRCVDITVRQSAQLTNRVALDNLAKLSGSPSAGTMAQCEAGANSVSVLGTPQCGDACCE